MKWKFIGVIGWSAIVLVGCGTPPGPPQESGTSVPAAVTARPTQPAPELTTPPPSGSISEIDSVNLCDLLPPAEFAELAGGTPLSELTDFGPACHYVIDPGDGTAASYNTFLYPTETIKPVMDYVRDYEAADWIDGYGDSAYIQDSASGNGYVLMILVEGRYGLEVGGPDKDVLRATAEVIMGRVQP
jgi:hypothetical protein